MSKSSSSGSGVGFFGMLTILFVGLKLTGFIAWSWLWVLSPIWLTLAVALSVFALAIVWSYVASKAKGGADGR